MHKLLYILLFVCSTGIAQDINHIWTNPISGPWTQQGTALKVDKNGFVYATGNFERNFELDSNGVKIDLSAAGAFYTDVYIVKYKPDGNLVWAKKIGGVRIEEANELLLDDDNNIYIAGTFEDTADFDPNYSNLPIVSKGGQDCFITKIDSNGNLEWINTYGGIGLDRMADISLTNDNKLIAIGDFQNTVNFNPKGNSVNLQSAGESDVFILNLDLTGNFNWIKQLKGTMYEKGKSITVDESNNIYALGNFEGTVDFDPNPLNTQQLSAFNNATPQVSITDIFILKLDNQGNYVWVKQIGGFRDNDASSIIADKQGAIYASGSFNAQNIFNLNTNQRDTINSTTTPYFDSFIYSFEPDGTNRWIRHLKGPGSNNITNFHIDHNNNLYCSGVFQFTTDFDFSNNDYFLTSAIDIDAFALKLNNRGNFIWARSIESQQGSSAILDIQTDRNNNVYLTGFWSSTADFDVGNSQYELTAEDFRSGFITKLNHCVKYRDTTQISACNKYIFKGNEYTESGNFEVVTYNDFQCDSIFKLELTINKVNISEIETTKENCPSQKNGSITLLNQESNYTYQLIPGNINLSINKFEGLKAQEYQLITTDSNNCFNTQNIRIEKENCCDNPFMPNAFSPNGDGINDEFGVKFITDYDLKAFQIYNRLGNLIFSNKDGWSWDGNYRGIPVELGTYFYLLQYKCLSSDKEYTIKGDIMLIR